MNRNFICFLTVFFCLLCERNVRGADSLPDYIPELLPFGTSSFNSIVTNECSTQILITYDRIDGGTSRYLTEKVGSYGLYQEYLNTIAQASMGLIYRIRAKETNPISNMKYCVIMKYVDTNAIIQIEKKGFSINTSLPDSPLAVNKQTFLNISPVIPSITFENTNILQFAISNSNGGMVMNSSNGVFNFQSLAVGAGRTRYYLTTQEGVAVYTEAGYRVKLPRITIQKRNYYIDFFEEISIFEYYELSITGSQSCDITLLRSDNLMDWGEVNYFPNITEVPIVIQDWERWAPSRFYKVRAD